MDIYTPLEEKYYAFLDWLDTIGIPLWKLAQPIEARGIPSFPIFVLVVLLVLGGLGWGIYTLLFGPKVYLVTVLDPNGNPVSGAVVRVGSERYITGPDGTVEIQLKGDESVWVLASGFKDIVLSPEDIQSNKQIILEPETKDAKIIVVDTRGRRIRAHIKVFGADRTYEFDGSEVSFKLSRVPTKDAIVVGDNLTVRVEVTAEGYQKAVKTLSWNAPSVTIRLKKKAPPSGTLYIHTDPAINGWAYLLVGNSPVYSGIIKAGMGTIRGVEYGTYTLKIVPVVNGKRVETLDNVFTVTVNAPTVTETFQVKVPDLNALLETIIHVVDANTNKPINAMITIKETNARYTVYNGTFTIQMKVDTTFTVTVSARKYYPQTFKISAGEEKTVRLIRMPATGTIKVTVVDIHGTPIQGAQVSLLTENEEVVAEGNRTDADGETIFGEVGVGKYIAEACKDAVCAKSEVFELKEDEIKEIRVTLAPGYGSIYVVLKVDGVPSLGTVKAIRSDTGEVLSRAEIGIEGEGHLEDIPAYVDFYIEAEAAGVTYVSTRMRLLPNEVKNISLDLKTEPEEGFKIVGMYIEDRKVGILQGGKTYATKIWYACKGTCSETFHILQGVGLFKDTDFPGEYTITVDGENPAGEGAYLSVSMKCEGLCEGVFSADVSVSPVATFGQKLTIQYDDTTFSAPIAWEGSCGEHVCASLHFERDGQTVDPQQLYEELKYDMEIDVLWGGGEIPYGKITVTPNGPADVELQGSSTYVYKGNIAYGTFLQITGSLYSEDPGYQEFTVTVSSCDASYTNCQDLDTYTVDAYFNEEMGHQLVIVATPEFFLDCPNFPIRIQLLNENGEPVEFDPDTMQLDVLGIREIGDAYITVRLNVEQTDGAFVVYIEDPTEFDYLLVRADGFNYNPAEVYLWKDDLSLEIEAASYYFTWDNEESKEFTVYNPNTIPIQITGISLSSSCVENIIWSASSSTIEPGETLTVSVKPTFSQSCGGSEVDDTLTIRFVPVIDGTPLTTCDRETSTEITYLIAPHCINITSLEQTDLDKLQISFRNDCSVNIAYAYADVLAYYSPYEGCSTCFSCNPPVEKTGSEKEYVITCTYYPTEESGNYAELSLDIHLNAMFETGVQEEERAVLSPFYYLDEDMVKDFVTFEPATTINPNQCTDPGVFVGTVRKTEAGAEYNWLAIDINSPQIEVNGYTYPGIIKGDLSEYNVYLPTRDPEQYNTPTWYAPFANKGTVDVSVTVNAVINVEGKPFSGRKIPVALSGDSHVSELNVSVYNTSIVNRSCGPILLKVNASSEEIPYKLQPDENYVFGSLFVCPDDVCELFTAPYSNYYHEIVYLVYNIGDEKELASYSLVPKEICLSRIPKPEINGYPIALAVGDWKISKNSQPTDLVIHTQDTFSDWKISANQSYPHVLVIAGEGLCVVWYKSAEGAEGKWESMCFEVEDLTSGPVYQIVSALNQTSRKDPLITTFPAEIQIDEKSKKVFTRQVSEITGDEGYALGIGEVDCAKELNDANVTVWSYISGELNVSQGYWGEYNGVLWYLDSNTIEELNLEDIVHEMDDTVDISAMYHNMEEVEGTLIPRAECTGGGNPQYTYFECDNVECSRIYSEEDFVQELNEALTYHEETNFYIVAVCVPEGHDSNYFNNYIIFHATVENGGYCWYVFDPETGTDTQSIGGTSCGQINNPPSVIITSPSNGQTFIASSFPYSITIQWNASDPDGDSLIFSIDCKNDGTPDASTSSTTYSCTYNSEGTYTAKVIAYDGKGGSASDTVSFTISTSGTYTYLNYLGGCSDYVCSAIEEVSSTGNTPGCKYTDMFGTVHYETDGSVTYKVHDEYYHCVQVNSTTYKWVIFSGPPGST